MRPSVGRLVGVALRIARTHICEAGLMDSSQILIWHGGSLLGVAAVACACCVWQSGRHRSERGGSLPLNAYLLVEMSQVSNSGMQSRMW